MDWADIANKCGTTPGAASKRYSRMKQAFDKGDTAPTTPSKPKNASNAAFGSASGSATTPKRKRAAASSPKKKAGSEKFKPDGDEDEEEDGDGDDEYVDKKPRRTKGGMGGIAAKPRATPKSKTKSKQSPAIKEEPDQSAGFLVPDANGDRRDNTYYNGNVLLTPTYSGTVNPTEATTLIEADPEALHARSNGMRGPLYGAPVDDGEDKFYDANEILGDDEETFKEESEL